MSKNKNIMKEIMLVIFKIRYKNNNDFKKTDIQINRTNSCIYSLLTFKICLEHIVGRMHKVFHLMLLENQLSHQED